MTRIGMAATLLEMRIRALRITNFQAFSDSGRIEFGDGINLIVGQNNSGKSSLLKSMHQSLPDDRHRDPQRFLPHLLLTPRIEFEVILTGSELSQAIMMSSDPLTIIVPGPGRENSLTFINRMLAENNLTFHVYKTIGERRFVPSRIPSHEFDVGSHEDIHFSTRVSINVNGEVHVTGMTSGGHEGIGTLISKTWESRIFYFSAERFGIGISDHKYDLQLQPDASNLPSVLHTVAGSRGSIIDRLKNHLREIFTNVGNISVRPHPEYSNKVEIRIWPTEEMEREELSFSLENSGTGVAQVLSLLTAIMTLDRGIFIIDEISSFLHPSAAKTLLKIIQADYSHHQYIISTHAPEIISVSNASSIHLVKRNGYDSSCDALDLRDIDNILAVASELGISMTDVFAAERVIWVEGPTEELCFPYIFRELVGPLPRGMAMISVVATGDFYSKKRDTTLIFNIYEKLSKASANITVSVAFSFDSEGLSESDKADLSRRSAGQVSFLPRRNIECYCLNSQAIHEFIMEKDSEDDQVISLSAVSSELTKLAVSNVFSPSSVPWTGCIDDSTWLQHVDGASLLSKVITNLTDHRVSFNKKDDTLSLLRSIKAIAPESLHELRDYVASLVKGISSK